MIEMMTSEDRVWKAFNHEEPDRVPLYEGAIQIPELNNGAVLSTSSGILFFSTGVLKYFGARWFTPLRTLFFKILERPAIITSVLKPIVKPVYQSITRIYHKLGIDLVAAVGGLPMVLNKRVFEDIKVKGGTVYAPSGDIATRVPEGTGAIYRNGFLRTPADYDKYIEFDADSPVNTFFTRELRDFAKGKFALTFSIFGAAYFENLCEMFGFDALFPLLVRDPGFIKRAVKDMSDYSVAVMEHMAREGDKMIFYMTDDLGHKGRSIISPRMYDRYFKAGVARFCRKAHEYGHKVMMHSDGNVMDLVPSFLDAGIDALHPWESDAGMNIFEGKKKWGDKLTLIGNVPIELLTRGTPKETEAYVSKLLGHVAPGGGYILSSSHSIVPSCKLENYRTMLLAARQLGGYPIRTKDHTTVHKG